MDIKRKTERPGLKVYLQVVDRETDRILGYAVDVTDKGFMLTSEQAIDTGLTFQLRLKLSAEIEGIKELDFTAVSRWSDQDPDTDFFNTGFQFIDLAPENEVVISRLLEKYCFGSADGDDSCTE